MDNWELAAIGGVSFLGGVLYAVYFWLQSGEAFDGKKFGKSILSAFFAGVAFGAGSMAIDQLEVRDLLTAFTSGVGVTAVGGKVL